MSTKTSTSPDLQLNPDAIPLSESTSSLAPLACHVEDVTEPCATPDCGLHTSANTPAVFQEMSPEVPDTDINIIEASLESSINGDIIHSDLSSEKNNNDGKPETGFDVERYTPITVEEQSQHSAIPSPPVTASPPPPPPPPPEVDQTAEQAPAPPQLQATVQTPSSAPVSTEQLEIAPVDRIPIPQTEAALPDTPIAENGSDTASSVQPQQQQQEAINWMFDDPSELQEHLSVDQHHYPSTQLELQAPDTSVSFPGVPPLKQNGPDEKILLDMIASEASADSKKSPCDSSLAEQYASFPPEASASKNNFLDEVEQDSGFSQLMGGVVSEMQDTAQQRYEGLPLIHDKELVVDTKKEMDFFGSEPDSGDDFFVGVDQVTVEPVFGVIQRKSTEQALYEEDQILPSGEEPVSINNESDNGLLKLEVDTPQASVLFSEPIPSDDDFFGQLDNRSQPIEAAPSKEDVTAKWQAALADDEFLDDDEGLLPSDDEGFLSDTAPTGLLSGEDSFSQNIMANHAPQNQPLTNPYIPQPSTFMPVPPQNDVQLGYFQSPQSFQQPPPPPPPSATVFSQPQNSQPLQKPTSFVDKTDGYKSPYDLPMDVVSPPRRKPNNPPGQTQFIGMVSTPSRSSSIGAVGSAFSVPPPAAPAGLPLQPFAKPKVAAPPKQQFFEDLPVALPKPRAPINAPGRYSQANSTSQPPPMSANGGHDAVSQHSGPSTHGAYDSPSAQHFVQNPQPNLPASFSQSTRVSPLSQTGIAYAPPPPAAPAIANRYSPAAPSAHCANIAGYAPPPVATQYPAQAQSISPATSGKYAPRPSVPPQSIGAVSSPYTPPLAPGQHVLPPVNMPAPPLAQQQHHIPPGSTSQYLPDGKRRHSGEYMSQASRPGTATSPASDMEIPREDAEDGSQSAIDPKQKRASIPPPRRFSGGNRYAPHGRSISSPSPQGGVTLPPTGAARRQISGQEQPARATSPGLETFQPPLRAQTGSPGLHFGRPKSIQKPRDPYERPSSALAHYTVPDDYTSKSHERVESLPAARKASVQLNFMPPNDITAMDELKRWQGAPVVTWGLNGITTMFPIHTQQFSNDIMQGPVIKSFPGDVKIRPVKEILPLPIDYDKFPGPIWTGSKSSNKIKKETISYMDSRIECFERTLMDIYDPTERRAAQEKCMLWKIVRIMIENNGVVEGTSEIETVVRKVLIPEVAQALDGQDNSGFVPMAGMPQMQAANAEAVNSEAVKTFRQKLLSGDREGAVWFATDNRLWAHALLISSTVGKDLWKRVIEEFVKAEVKTLGNGSESLAVLYETFAGNWEQSVDELIPPSTRMGMPMLSTGQMQERSLEERLSKWRETLGLILSNRSPGDQASIIALGRLLSSYGWIAASHICFIFARQSVPGGAGAIFGGPYEPTTDFSLLGADHRSKINLGTDSDSILLSEIYEFAVTLSPHASNAAPIFPHLQIWKIQHAIILAENGKNTAAQKYCDSVAAAVKAWGKPSPYFNQTFGHILEDLTRRLQEAPRDMSTAAGSSKWIPKLTSDAVSSSVWGAFNKFVSGDDDGRGAAASSQQEADGPFGRFTPDVSRVQSSTDLYGTYASGGAMYTPGTASSGSSPTAMRPQLMPQGTAGRYAPSTATARSSLDGPRPNTYDPNGHRVSSESQRGTSINGVGYDLNGIYDSYHGGLSTGAYEPPANSFERSRPASSSGGHGQTQYAPKASLEATPEVSEKSNSLIKDTGYSQFSSPSNGYESASAGFSGYEPPSDNFVPYQPEPDDDDTDEKEKPKSKKKGLMDDDEDDAAFLKKAAAVKKEAEAVAKRKEEESKASNSQGASQKKGWFGGWFGRKDPSDQPGPIKAKLGEDNAFVYDPDLKRWVNKKSGSDSAPLSKPAPPPKRTPTPSGSTPPASVPKFSATSAPRGNENSLISPPQPSQSAPPAAMLSPPSLGPPRGMTPSPVPSTSRFGKSGSRPSTSGGPDPMDELLGPPMSRKGTPSGTRRGKKGASRYVEVIPGQQM